MKNWQGVHRVIEAYMVNRVSQELYDNKKSKLPSIGEATWDGKSDELVVKMEPLFHQMLTQKRDVISSKRRTKK